MKLSIPDNVNTDRLYLRPLRYEDADEIFHVYASRAEATRFVSWPTHRSIEDTRQFLNDAVRGWQQGTDYSFSIRKKENHRFIGTFGLLNDNGKIQVGYALGPLHWGNGYATEACSQVLSVLQRVERIYRVGSFVDAENIASAKVLVKSGMVEEARLPEWFRFVNQGNQPKDCILFRLPL